MGKGLIQEGECINVTAGSALPLITGFPNSSTNNRLGCGHHNTKQVRKPHMRQNLLAFTSIRLRSRIQRVCTLHQMSIVLVVVGSPQKESKGSCRKTPLGPL